MSNERPMTLREYIEFKLPESHPARQELQRLEGEVERLQALHIERTKTTHAALTEKIEKIADLEAHLDEFKRIADKGFAQRDARLGQKESQINLYLKTIAGKDARIAEQDKEIERLNYHLHAQRALK